MGTEYIFQPTRESAGGNETKQCQRSEKKFRPRRAKWACYACHKRKVRCDALNQGTACTNCKLDMKECVAPPRRRKKAAAPSPWIPSEARTDHTPTSPCALQNSATPDPKCTDIQSNSASVSSRKRKSPPRSLDSPRTSPQQRKCPSEGSSHSVDDEVGLWMDMLPPNVLEQLELRSTKDIARPRRDTVDGLSAERFHHECSEKLLQAVDILTEVIIMHNSLSAHTTPSAPVANSEADIHYVLGDDDSEKEQNMEYSSSACRQIGEKIWDIEKTQDGSSALTPESLEFVAGSNYNIWLELNDFDLKGPSSLGPYNAE